MKPATLTLSLALLTAVLFAVSLLTGPAQLGLSESVRGLFAGGGEAAIIIMREIRLPRALLGLGIGFSLGISGAVLQGFLRNPLAEPGIVGVSATAAFGAVLIFYTGLAGA
jgi:iron complex transport system permease protein